MMLKPQKKQQSTCFKLKELLYEFYTQILMQNQFTFLFWLICYIISFFQVLDFIFHPFHEDVSDQGFISGLIVDIFEYCSVFFVCLI